MRVGTKGSSLLSFTQLQDINARCIIFHAYVYRHFCQEANFGRDGARKLVVVEFEGVFHVGEVLQRDLRDMAGEAVVAHVKVRRQLRHEVNLFIFEEHVSVNVVARLNQVHRNGSLHKSRFRVSKYYT